MLFTKDYPQADGVTPETRLTIINQVDAQTDVTLYTCLGAANRQHRNIPVRVWATPGAAYVDVADDLMTAALQGHAVAVAAQRHGEFKLVALAPDDLYQSIPDFFTAADWAKQAGYSMLATPAPLLPAPSLLQVSLLGFPGKWNILQLR